MKETIVSIYDPAEVEGGLSLTAAASLHIKKMLAKQSDEKSFRLSVKQSGCSGFSYVVDYVKTLNTNDLQFSINDDLVVFVDQASFPYLKGICIDYVQNGLNGSLKFINPNQTAACGCGESFSIEKGKIEG
ncbi:iron-sulfur cluster assembly protein [Candidatus Rickettsiella viridis]|uniref:Iron-sulfur cluster assembly protein n=1 Tax=Candidatus Rickettsiella viridis TaxID=676208 RepID=A0A2Z5V6T5_9COXI|nr:iron-sulfur cluster assembly accessory protein [Candidatus Rickettsiella viridis]BBB14617.1 iron-sulfur cluster assembly protein [Candidatus Rickettsiella viridis]